MRCGGRWRRRGGRSCSPRARCFSRSARWQCSRCTSCARWRTPGAVSWRWPGLYAVVVAPAVIKLLGDRIESLNIRTLFRRTKPDPDVRHGSLYRVATFVMRHALPCALAVVALLLLLGSPFARARFGLPDDRVLPTTAQSRQVGDIVRHQFPADPAMATSIVIPDARGLDRCGRRRLCQCAVERARRGSRCRAERFIRPG